MFWDVPPPHTPKPQPAADSDFYTKTWATMAEQVTIARTARRNIGHTPCDDRAPCKHCRVIRDAHTSINDHLDQYEVAALEDKLSKP